jgi:NAD(P)-dependent dehydrogenase (short-subunit alcohol dehydrogenase family)
MSSSAAGSAGRHTWFITGATSGIGQALAVGVVGRADNALATWAEVTNNVDTPGS